MEKQSTPNPEEFFSAYGPDVRDIAMLARRLVLSVIPDAIERVDTGYNFVSYSTGPKAPDLVFYISAHKAHADIGLRGADLPDPNGLMEGTGKQMRHVKLRKSEDVDNPSLRALLESAFNKHRGLAHAEET
jgi:Domain of unknown function (DU1801)